MALDSAKPTDSQSSSTLIVDPGLQLQCDKCEHLLESNKSLLNKLSELESKHDDEIKEMRDKIEKEFDQKLLEHRANLETVTKEEELRMKLVKSNEENISLKQENIKLLKNYTIQVKIQIDKYNDLKELYDKKMETAPITDLETLKIVHNKQMKELEEKLKKEYEKKLLDQRVGLEKKAKSKLDQLRKELTKFLDISIDTKAQPEKEIDKDEEVMIINESFASQSNKKKKKNNPTVPDCEPAQKKQKSSIPSIQSYTSTDGPRGSLPSIGRELVVSNDKLGYTEIPENHSAVRICSICRWVEKICYSNYAKHFLDNHSSVFSGKMSSLFKELILDEEIFFSLKNEYERNQISDELINLNCYRISKGSLIVRLCSICKYVELARKTSQSVHLKEHQDELDIAGTVDSIYEIVVMKESKYQQLKSKRKRKY
ncbi:uncharacterized protein LOC128392404 isoform X2 [Panonychus citri]|nr:uncharacterized protein LOC128392404 isoform X2 [Panonychus citri]